MRLMSRLTGEQTQEDQFHEEIPRLITETEFRQSVTPEVTAASLNMLSPRLQCFNQKSFVNARRQELFVLVEVRPNSLQSDAIKLTFCSGAINWMF